MHPGDLHAVEEAEEKEVSVAVSTQGTWSGVDADTFFNICLFLGHLPDILRVMRTCQAWSRQGENERIWAKMCDRAGWPQLGKKWFLVKYRDVKLFRRPPVKNTLKTKHPVLSMFAPTPVRVFNWKWGKVTSLNSNLLTVAEVSGGTGLTVWDATKTTPVRSESDGDAKASYAGNWSTVAICDTRVVYADSKTAEVIVRELDTGESYILGRHNSAVTCLKADRGGKVAVSCSYDQTVRVWDLSRYSHQLTIHLPQRLWAVAVHPKCARVAGGTDKTLHVWRAVDGKKICKLYPPKEGTILTLEFDPVEPDALIFAGGCDKEIRLWNYISGQCIRTFTGHRDYVFGCVPLSNLLITCSRDHTARIYDKHTGESLQELKGHDMDVKCVIHLEPDKIATGGYDKRINVWSFPKPDEDAEAVLQDPTTDACTIQ
uniref:F-box domain-containing protein n=1 Tax=Lotharella globosa TaxID=91324 RepID=A0A7S4DWV3_9EUKA|mmetsp:Transcript_24880/g.48691  ORF Transcript_24880/g.48691 Transcript_24880/m.48691 type:complete len:430 (+) Transcript_24880:18-1307(+)